MPRRSAEELYKQLREAEKQTAEHQELLWAIEDLEQAARPFRRFRGRRQLPTLKARDREQLMRLHQNVGAKAEALLAGDDRPAVKEMVRRLEALSAHNYRALLEYDPAKKPMTLEAIEENSRTLTLHLGADESNGDKWSDALSERRPLSFYDNKGNKITGLFTKKNTLQVLPSFHAALEGALEDCPQEDRETAKAVFDLLRAKLGDPEAMRKVVGDKTLPITEDPVLNVCSLLRHTSMVDDNGGRRIDSMTLSYALRRILSRELAEKFTDQMGEFLANRLSPMRLTTTVHVGKAGIPDGARLDNRNAAMNTVADLLGMPDVVARARPMKLVQADGSEVEGTFMELAKGLDIRNLSEKARQVSAESLKDSDGKGMRAVANLQILDYICGNVDRHSGNFMYQFDKHNKFCGVQGFDNDSSFGTVVPQNGEGVNRLVGTKNLMAIPRDTYERVMQLKPATLKYALRGYGLSEEELNAAGRRLTDLQKHLEKEKEFYEKYDRENDIRPLLDEHTRILEDEDWSDYEASEFYLSEKVNHKNQHLSLENTFALAASGVKSIPRRYAKQEKQFKDLSKILAVGIRNRANSSTAGREQKKAAELSKLLDKRSWWGFSSGNYRSMERAVKAYADCQKQISERLKAAGDQDARRRADYDRSMEAVVTREDLERMRQLSERMREAAQTYLDGKLVNGQVPADASDYTKKRIAIALNVFSYGEQGATIRSEEQRMAQANEAQAQASRTQRRQDQAAEQQEAQELQMGR